MTTQKLTVITDDFILKESYVDPNGDTIWDIKDPKLDTNFVVHTSSTGTLFVKFFRGSYVSNKCSLNALREICKILLERNLNPSIRIYHKNKPLIALCCRIGFRPKKDIKNQYYLKKLK